MKYLKKFDTDEQYEEYINSDDAVFPNVSLCTGNNYSKVYFNPNGKAVFTYNVLNIGETTKLFNIPDDPNQPLGIKSMEVDGVVIEPVEFSHNNYIFSEKGYHSVKYTFYNNEISGARFFNCPDLIFIDVPNNIRAVDSYAFDGTAWYNNQPDGFVYVGNVLYGYKGTVPTKITIREGTLGIGGRAFYNCKNLISINIPDSVTSIGDYAFYNCTNLISVNIPNSVTSIGVWAFYNCSALTSVIVLATTPPTLISSGTFNNNASGRKIYVPAESVNAYKAAAKWSDYADYIEAIPSEINLLNDADNSTTLNTWNGVTLDVKLKDRTLYKDGYWNTICLPFSLSSLIGTPLEGAIVKKLNYSQYDAEQSELYIDFEDVNNIDAGTPYLIKWTPASDYVDDDAHNLVEPIFSGVTINNTLSPIETEYVDCIGTMSPVILEANDVTKFYIGGDNTPYFPGENITINSLRIYFQLKKGLTASDMSINPNT